MIKSCYTGNKKGYIFSEYYFHEYKIIRFHDCDGTGQWISDWLDYFFHLQVLNLVE
jgi:hypothetical protein